LNLQKHTLEFIPYNNLKNTRLAQDFLCYTICNMTKNFCEERTIYVFQAHYGNLNESECTTPILYFRRLWLKTSNCDGSIYNVGQKSFLYEWGKQVKRPFEKRYTAGPYILNFHKLASSFVTLIYWNNQKWMFLIRLHLQKHTY
jgi:hypothetical protein